VKQYEDAIKAHKAGRPVDVLELPAPPGYPPLPSINARAAAPVAAASGGIISFIKPKSVFNLLIG
jgi:coiled-coil and C2 domain-containing protein 1